MSSRDLILGAVRRARPAGATLPDLPAIRGAAGARDADDRDGDLTARFADAARAGGASVVELARGEVAAYVATVAPTHGRVVTAPPAPGGAPFTVSDPRAYADVDLFVCEGVLGVAEGGAIWLPESQLGVRSAFFLATHVAVVLDRGAIVGTLHDAYARLDVAREPFGVFVAGPSKTADIEQALVIGAHGPKALTVLLTER